MTLWRKPSQKAFRHENCVLCLKADEKKPKTNLEHSLQEARGKTFLNTWEWRKISIMSNLDCKSSKIDRFVSVRHSPYSPNTALCQIMLHNSKRPKRTKWLLFRVLYNGSVECLHRIIVLKAFINKLDFLCNNRKSHDAKGHKRYKNKEFNLSFSSDYIILEYYDRACGWCAFFIL
mgnify:CR=1 FL=1